MEVDRSTLRFAVGYSLSYAQILYVLHVPSCLHCLKVARGTNGQDCSSNKHSMA